MEQKANWDEIRKEYIQGGISYRALAAKYGVPMRTLAARAKAENWVGLREQACNKAATETVKAVAKETAKVNKRIYGIANDLLDVVARAVGELDATVVTKRNKIKTNVSETSVEYRSIDKEKQGPVDRAGMRQVAETLRALKEIMDVRTDMDMQEQEARIANLRRQAEPEQQEKPELIIQGLPEEFKA